MMVRISGLFVISPFFGSMNVAPLVRIGLMFSISILIFPVVDNMGVIELPTTVWGYAATALIELFIGWLTGFIAYISFSAIHMAGKVMDMQVGFSIVNVMDPTSGQQIPLIGSFLYNFGLIIFLVINGHHVLISALVESFSTVPLVSAIIDTSLTKLISDFTGAVLMTGMKVAMPVTFAILLTNVALGILARTMPQLNIFVVGLPLQIVIGIFVLSIVLPFYIIFLDVLFNEMYGNISATFKALS